jgi:hypothetical protein
MKDLEQWKIFYPRVVFFRIYKSFIVAKEQITNWNANSVTVNNRDIPIGRTYKMIFYTELKINFLNIVKKINPKIYYLEADKNITF